MVKYIVYQNMIGKEGERGRLESAQPPAPSSVDTGNDATRGVESVRQQPDTAQVLFAPQRDVLSRERQQPEGNALPDGGAIPVAELPPSPEATVVQLSAARYQELLAAEQTLQRIRRQQRSATKKWKQQHPQEHKELDRQWAERRRGSKPPSDTRA